MPLPLGETSTAGNLKLVKFADNFPNWGDTMNTNLDVIDAAVSAVQTGSASVAIDAINAELGAPDGIATLDDSAKIPIDQIPTAALPTQPVVFPQSTPLAIWVIVHNLGKYPNVVIVDSSGAFVVGGIKYDSFDQVTLTFSGAFSGTAVLT
jgi:hypothetical protein